MPLITISVGASCSIVFGRCIYIDLFYHTCAFQKVCIMLKYEDTLNLIKKYKNKEFLDVV